jgi:hypothetical protein
VAFPTSIETIDGFDVELMMVETWDGLYAPIGVRTPEGEGPFPMVLLASGNGGDGLGWLLCLAPVSHRGGARLQPRGAPDP